MHILSWSIFTKLINNLNFHKSLLFKNYLMLDLGNYLTCLEKLIFLYYIFLRASLFSYKLIQDFYYNSPQS